MERAAIEQRFSLAAGEPSSNYSDQVNVWNYALNDLSEDNIRALVTHPDAVDTNDIDRGRFTVSPQPPRSDDPYLGVEYVAWLQYPGWTLFLATAVFAWMLGFVVPVALASSGGRNAADSLEMAMSEPFYRRALPFTLFIVPFVLWSARPTLSPLPVVPDRPAGVGDAEGHGHADGVCDNAPGTGAVFRGHSGRRTSDASRTDGMPARLRRDRMVTCSRPE